MSDAKVGVVADGQPDQADIYISALDSLNHRRIRILQRLKADLRVPQAKPGQQPGQYSAHCRADESQFERARLAACNQPGLVASLMSMHEGLPCIFQRRRHGHGKSYRSEEHTSELQSLMRISYTVFCLKKTTQR